MGRDIFTAAAALALALVTALPAAGQPLPTGTDAREALPAADAALTSEVIPHPSLNSAEIELLAGAVDQGLLPTMAFYGAIAMAPDAGLADPDTTAAVANFHDAESASAAALAQCEEGREDVGEPCTVVVIVRPEGWELGPGLSLSARATEALGEEWRETDRPRVMAISPATGNYAVANGVPAAITECGAEDCRPVIADP